MPNFSCFFLSFGSFSATPNIFISIIPYFPSFLQTQKAKIRKPSFLSEITAVKLNDYEKSVATVVNRLHLIAKNKQQKRAEQSARRFAMKEKENSRVSLCFAK